MANIDVSKIITAEMREAAIEAAALLPLTRRQMKLGLLSIGITGQMVEAELAEIEDTFDREYALIEWQEAGQIERSHPLVDELADAFSLPAEQVDTLWVWASSL